ncbi:DNA polymerase III subunit delta' [Zophobihabitans entericus]|uniref:DNA polymerase III subunit delta' n=1 Tax=Zophobihabitans entericus TaxID=1635327 RepID=A0A6G9I9M1_9GAMM|nr:DNA polymerase III subunit delta' [Zophobihabitans entericus]QIQ20913.1 DNA polymerase III subunit delta' [Zophobihabitans entericus]
MLNYPWLVKPYQQLVEPIVQNRAHHALLINYVQGCGEGELITLLANRLLCLTPDQGQPCGHCHSCLLFKAETHPDFYIITVEKDKKTIGIDQIRQLTTKVYEHSQQGGAKVIWVKEAGLMTEAAANALLKTLEEPPEQTFFILSDAQLNKLPATIRSRCGYFYLAAPELDDSVNWLKQYYQNYNDNQLATALLLNHQAPLAAKVLLEPEHWQKREQFCQTLTELIPTNQFWLLLPALNNDDVLFRLHGFCSLLADAMKAQNKAGKFITHRDQVPLVRLLARIETTKLLALYQLWQHALQQLTSIAGLNQELVLSNLLAQSELINT